jgi:hypothetical protein
VNSTNKGNIDKWSGYNTRFQNVENGKLMARISVYGAQSGQEVEILMHAMANATDVYAVVTEDCYIAYLDKPFTRELEPNTDGIAFAALMEATLEVRGPYSAGYVVLS